jgi:hypothetical protein
MIEQAKRREKEEEEHAAVGAGEEEGTKRGAGWWPVAPSMLLDPPVGSGGTTSGSSSSISSSGGGDRHSVGGNADGGSSSSSSSSSGGGDRHSVGGNAGGRSSSNNNSSTLKRRDAALLTLFFKRLVSLCWQRILLLDQTLEERSGKRKWCEVNSKLDTQGEKLKHLECIFALVLTCLRDHSSPLLLHGRSVFHLVLCAFYFVSHAAPLAFPPPSSSSPPPSAVTFAALIDAATWLARSDSNSHNSAVVVVVADIALTAVHERGNIITFYNTVFLPETKSHLQEVVARMKEASSRSSSNKLQEGEAGAPVLLPLMLPLPGEEKSSENKACKRKRSISDQCLGRIEVDSGRCLGGTTPALAQGRTGGSSIRDQPSGPVLCYTFGESPSNVLHLANRGVSMKLG